MNQRREGQTHQQHPFSHQNATMSKSFVVTLCLPVNRNLY